MTSASRVDVTAWNSSLKYGFGHTSGEIDPVEILRIILSRRHGFVPEEEFPVKAPAFGFLAAPPLYRGRGWSQIGHEERGGFAGRQKIFNAIQSLYLSHNKPRDRKIAERLTSLYQDALEEDEAIQANSLTQFTRFFLENPNIGLPKVTLTPDATLRVRWIRGERDFFAVEFTGKPLLKIVAELPRPEQESGTYFGNETPEYVVSTARALGASLD